MLKSKIISELINSDIKIKSKQKLEEYVEYCINNNKKQE